jgi:hypothetical protein
MKNLPNTYIDMDGVLANFHKSACRAFQVEYPRNSVLFFDWLVGKADWGGTVEGFYASIEKDPRFWHDIEPYPWLHDLTEFLDVEAPKRPYPADPSWRMLSNAYLNPEAWHGKVDWVRRHLGPDGPFKLTLIAGSKDHICRPGDILVDDHKKNCERWVAQGGRAFLWR